MQAPQDFRRHSLQLQARGFFHPKKTPNWLKLSPAEQDAAVFAAAVAARSRDPHNRIWQAVPKLGRDTPYYPIPLPPIERRHSICHVYPSRANDDWRVSVESLTSRAEVFDGDRIAAISVDASTHAFGYAAAMLRESGWRCYEMPNDPLLREVLTFLPLLCWIKPSLGANDAVFYCHTKGNTTADGFDGARLWRERMYEALLSRDKLGAVLSSLERYDFAGCCKICWTDVDQNPFPSGLDVGRWMLAGTFYWFRASVLDGDRWRAVPIDRYGAEAWPSIVRPDHHRAVSHYQPWPEEQYPTPNPYAVATHEVLR